MNLPTNFKYKILSIDGGGIRGIIPAVILDEIEKRTQQSIYKLFDMIAGTSTGGLLTLGLTVPKQPNSKEAKHKAEKLIDFYKDQGKEIFKESGIASNLDSVLKKLLNTMGQELPPGDPLDLFQPRYKSDGREKVLKEFLGGNLIENSLTEVFITSYDTELRTPVIFTSNRKAENTKGVFRKICQGITMVESAMATSAAPTYFEPYRINTTHQTENGHYSLIDGGIFANNPTALALAQALREHKELNLKDILIVSIGTGSLTRKLFYRDIKKWGQIQWALPLLNIVLDGQSEAVTCQLDELLCDEKAGRKQYYRFQGRLDKGSDDIDNTNLENLNKLEDVAKLILKDKKNDFEELCNLLLTEMSGRVTDRKNTDI